MFWYETIHLSDNETGFADGGRPGRARVCAGRAVVDLDANPVATPDVSRRVVDLADPVETPLATAVGHGRLGVRVGSHIRSRGDSDTRRGQAE